MKRKSSAALSKGIAVNRPTYVDDGTNPTKVPLGDMPLCQTVEFEQGEFVPPPRYVALSDELVYYVVKYVSQKERYANWPVDFDGRLIELLVKLVKVE